MNEGRSGAAAARGLRIVAYNFLVGGSRNRCGHWSRLLDAFAPDVVLAQECRRPEDSPGESYRPAAGEALHWGAAGAAHWGSAILARAGALARIHVPDYDGWVVGGELLVGEERVGAGAAAHGATADARVDFAAADRAARGEAGGVHRPVRIFSIHCPAGRRGYIRTMHEILDRLAPLGEDADLVLGGDFNVVVGYRRPTDPIRMTRGEREILDRLTNDLALIPCWQTANPGRPLAQTLRWSGNRAAPYHCDGIFVPAAWRDRLERCEVADGPEWQRLSDHNPVVATVAPATAARTRPAPR